MLLALLVLAAPRDVAVQKIKQALSQQSVLFTSDNVALLSDAAALAKGDAELEALARLYLSQPLQRQGKYGEAQAELERSLQLRKHQDTYLALTRLHAQLGDYDKAFAALENVPDGLLRAVELGSLYADLGDDVRAIETLTAALALPAEPRFKATRGRAHGLLGVIYKNQERYDEALAEFDARNRLIENQSMRELLQDSLDVNVEKGDFAAAMQTMKVYTDLRAGGKILLAEAEWADAVDYWTRYFGEVTPLRDEQTFTALCGLGLAQLGRGDKAKARDAFGRAIELVEQQRDTVAPAQRGTFFSAKLWGYRRTLPYEGLMAVEKSAEAAFTASDAIKGRVMAETMARAASPASVPPALAEEEQRLQAELRRVALAYEAANRMNDRLGLAEAAKQREKARAAVTAFAGRLRAAAPEYAAAKYPLPVAPKDVPLAKNETLVAFEVTETHVYVFKLRAGKVTQHAVAIDRKTLGNEVRRFRAFFEGIDSTDALARFQPALGKALYDKLLAPLRLTAGETIILVPDEVLALLPFEALPVALPAKEQMGTGEHGPFPLGVQYVGDTYDVMYASSATALTIARTAKRSVAASSLFVAADPVFGAATPELKAWKTMGVAGVAARGAAKTEEVFPRLEKTALLAEKLRSLFAPAATVLLREEASEPRVKAASLELFRYLAFATHGILDNALPNVREPALVLSQVGLGPANDGFLTLSEVAGMRLNADVVALTACDTGVGKQVSGEGVQGMGRAFQLAGAKTVLMSLWSVAESSSADLAQAVFASLKGGDTPVAAMRKARAAIRQKGYEHPFYWSAFIVVGS